MNEGLDAGRRSQRSKAEYINSDGRQESQLNTKHSQVEEVTLPFISDRIWKPFSIKLYIRLGRVAGGGKGNQVNRLGSAWKTCFPEGLCWEAGVCRKGTRSAQRDSG